MGTYGLPVPAKASIAASATAPSRSALVASPGLAVWTAPSASLNALTTAGRSVQIDDNRGGPLGSDGVGLSVVTDKCGHLVPMGLQLREYVRSNEPSCSRQCHFHA